MNDLQDEVNAIEGGYLNATARLNAGASTLASLSVAGGSTLVTLTVTGLITATGGQIGFPATQSASADANTLDDYEEGTWVPTDQSGAALSLTVTNATYTKIGRVVFVRAHVVYPNTANGSSAKIGGLPFTVALYGACAISSDSATAVQVGEFLGATTNMQPLATSGAGVITNANLSTKFVIFSGQYEV